MIRNTESLQMEIIGPNGDFTIHVSSRPKHAEILSDSMTHHIFPHIIFKTISCCWFIGTATYMEIVIRNQQKQNELLRDIAMKLDTEQKRLPKNE